METDIGNRTLFMLHGDECAYVKGHYCGENANKHGLCSSTSHLVSSHLFVVVVVVIIGGGGYSFRARLSRPL